MTYRALLISKEGDGLGVAQRMVAEGSKVRVWVAEPRFAKAGEGIVERVPEWEPSVEWADFIITDCVGLGKHETRLKGAGKPVLGCSEVLDKIELDRALGMRLFEMAGIAIPPTYEFSSCKEADTIRREFPWDKGWVIKPSGNLSTSKTMVVKDQSQWTASLACLSPDCTGIVQRVVDGVEVSTEGWFNGRHFLSPMNHTFEEKRFLAGGLGVNTGCMGNVVLAAPPGGDALTHATVARLSGFLAQIGYRGPLDVNCIVNETGAYALEATSRMGYDAVEALAEGLTVPLSDFLYDVACGTAEDCPLAEGQTMIAVRVSIPPWPVRKPDQSSAGEIVEGIDDSTLPHLFLTDLYRDTTTGEYKTAGGDGVLLKATAKGPARRLNDADLRDDYTFYARRKVYRLLDDIKVSSRQWRTDIGERVNGDMSRLKEWGWL